VTIQSDYFIETSEINTTVSEKNPTQISFSVAKRPSSQYSARSESIAQVQGTGTAQTTFTNLENGTYDVLVKFSNVGCGTGLSPCPFPLAYIYTEFTLENGVITATGTNEIYTNLNPPILSNEYENCDLSHIGGCINNSLRFLFTPSNSSINSLLITKDQIDQKIPFVYLGEIQTIANEVFNTPEGQTLDMTVSIFGSELTLISKQMIENVPYVDLLHDLIDASLWILFAMVMYRMALNVHNHDNKTAT